MVVGRLRQEDCLELAACLVPVANYRLLGDSVSKKGKEKKRQHLQGVKKGAVPAPAQTNTGYTHSPMQKCDRDAGVLCRRVLGLVVGSAGAAGCECWW